MGPLSGIRIIELAGIGPAPFCGMMLADMGAEVIRIDRTKKTDLGTNGNPAVDFLNRGKKSVAVDLKSKAGVNLVLELLIKADALIEGFRPGVTERLGLGPVQCANVNEKLVYGRVTGWGQTGPMSLIAGHDINYIALTGVLHAIGPKDGKPVPPLNLVGDFGGGGMLLACGILSALLNASRTGIGQVVDVAITEGSLALMVRQFSMRAEGCWSDERGTNIFDSGAPFYDVYETLDGKYVAVGSIEARFFSELLRKLGLDAATFPSQWDKTRWDEMCEFFSNHFAQRTQQDWINVFVESDACVTPVLTMSEAQGHPHFVERNAIISNARRPQPAPAPTFSNTTLDMPSAPPKPGEHTRSALEEWGISSSSIDDLLNIGAVMDLGLQKHS